MLDTDHTPDLMQRARVVLDWTVFTVGVLSLSAAIVATVLSKTDLFGANDAEVKQAVDQRNG
ncbi:MAG: hypothetical protein QNJ44_15325 [Rhodobacter sp.]|nr:hypothetical protein [Rhodobacter sp.]